MPIYEYKALARGGKLKTGVADADSPKDARDKLRSQGIHVVELTPIKKREDQRGALLRFRKPNPLTMAMATRQLATLVESDIPLRDAIGALIDQLEDERMQLIFRDVREKLTSGTPFAEALEDHRGFFGDLYINMIKAGEASGNLDPILNKLADYLQAQGRMKGKVSAALAYPMVMMFIGTAVVIFLMTFVVPKIEGVIKSQKKGASMPLPTEILITCSDFVIAWWPFLLLGCIGGIVGFMLFVRTPRGRRLYDIVLLNLPIVGILFKKQAVSRFAVTFSTLLSSGIPALDGLRIVANIVDNVPMRETLQEVQKNIIEGGDMATPIRKSKVFPPVVSYMVSVGEQSGKLESVLAKLANSYDEEVDLTTQKVTSLIEPLMIVALALIVGFIVLAIVLPIMQMNKLG